MNFSAKMLSVTWWRRRLRWEERVQVSVRIRLKLVGVFKQLSNSWEERVSLCPLSWFSNKTMTWIKKDTIQYPAVSRMFLGHRGNWWWGFWVSGRKCRSLSAQSRPAGLLWTDLLSPNRMLSEERPHVLLNQFPCETILTTKDCLASVARRVGRGQGPPWLPRTFNLQTELPQFIRNYQQRQERWGICTGH